MFTPKLETVQTVQRLGEVIEFILESGENEFAIDTETSGLKWYNSYVCGWCLGVYRNQQYYGWYIPVRHTTGGNIDDVAEAEVLIRVLLNSDMNRILFNAKFDINMAKNHMLDIAWQEDKVHDAMLLMFLRNEREKSHSMKSLGAKYIDPSVDTLDKQIKDWFNKTKPDDGYASCPVDLLGPYAALDGALTMALWHFGSNDIITKEESPTKDGVRWDKYLHERDFMLVVTDMERTGFPFDIDYAKSLTERVAMARDGLAEHIYALVGKEFNADSDKEINAVLTGMGYKPTKFSWRTGEPSWDREALLALDNAELGECLAAYRNLAHSVNSFGESLYGYAEDALKHIGDARICCSYNQIGARTGRASASEPNLQQIPTRLPKYKHIPDYAMHGVKEAFAIRKAFKAPPGWKVVKIDESQFELRVLDHFAQDKIMHQAFVDGKDIHTFVACMIFNRKYDDFMEALASGTGDAKFERTVAKECGFAILYGAGAPRLQSTIQSYGVKITLPDTKRFFSRYKDVFEGVDAFVRKVQETVRRRGYIFNEYGRHKRIEANKAYTGVNHLIQGLTADMLKDAAIKCRRSLMNYSSSLMMMVHDEGDFLVHDDELHVVIPMVKGHMEDFPWCRTPIVAEVEVGPSWGELEKWNG